MLFRLWWHLSSSPCGLCLSPPFISCMHTPHHTTYRNSYELCHYFPSLISNSYFTMLYIWTSPWLVAVWNHLYRVTCSLDGDRCGLHMVGATSDAPYMRMHVICRCHHWINKIARISNPLIKVEVLNPGHVSRLDSMLSIFGHVGTPTRSILIAPKTCVN
jgi:hypothetical protein